MARLFLTAAAAIILVAGCNKLQLIESPEQESATLSASISDYPATKATINCKHPINDTFQSSVKVRDVREVQRSLTKFSELRD